MTWGYCAMAAIAVVGASASAEQGAANSDVASANAKLNAANQTLGAAKQTLADNTAIIKANVANTVRTGYRVGLANMQRGLQKRQNIQHGFDITKAGVDALGQSSANAAAAGSIGSSVDAVAQDIQMKVGEATASLANKAETDAANFNTQIESLVTEGNMALQSGREVGISATVNTSAGGVSVGGAALLAGVSSFASNYYSNKMSLGVGSSAPTTTPTNPSGYDGSAGQG